MISVVLYGRNDNYGYNLHKRAALSFNCMAEVLRDEDDEILFVDYNTPNDYPTFPEAIQDTLSDRARKKLRIFRVRPRIHRRFSSTTKLVALEPISRNIAVRRSNPANRWILSTNTDMIFVPRRRASLSEITRDLPAGFYHAPRIEIPETLWEGLDRHNGQEAIDTVREWGAALHINEIVLGSPVILYDGPGDFQLMQRADLFRIDGFDEEMVLGWHVDSNIAKRLTMLHGKVGDLGEQIYGYHCDHTRQVTPAHSSTRTENDWQRFVVNLERPNIPRQARKWGCADDVIEEIRLTGQTASAYVTALKEQIGERQSGPPVVAYVGENYNKTDYDPRHVLPYLADMFVCSEKTTNLGWFGSRADTLSRFAGFWKRAGFTGDILLDSALVREQGLANTPQAVEANSETVVSKADAFVFDFGRVFEKTDGIAGIPRSLAKSLNHALLQVVAAEHKRLREGRAPRQIIAINAINNDFESGIMAHVSAALTPFSTRMRHGFVTPPVQGEADWLPRLLAGHAGSRDGSVIRSRKDSLGAVTRGPYLHLRGGSYRIKMRLSGTSPSAYSGNDAVAVLEIISQRDHLAHRLITPSDLAKGEIEIDFDVTQDGSATPGFSVQTALRTLAPVELAISAVNCERVSDLKSEMMPDPALSVKEWLPLLWTGPDAKRLNGVIFYPSTRPTILFYGPYWRLSQGSYEAVLELEAAPTWVVWQALVRAYSKTALLSLVALWRRARGQPIGAFRGRYPLCTFQAMNRETELASRIIYVGSWPLEKQLVIPFDVTTSQSEDPGCGMDFRLLAHTQLPFGFKSFVVRRVQN
ncbi:MAG: hypothetical protein JOZ88_05330 [Hyphomicrobiales bacterium]|nr:hypothetical protein [Hyphomicrobiales bacterium]